MEKFFIEKIRNYFSDRIEEIQGGRYVPTYEKIKELPEFSGIKRENFKKARKKWYSQHFGMTFRMFNEHSKRLGPIKARNISNSEYDKKRKRKRGFCILIIGAFPILIALMAGAIPLSIKGWNPSSGSGFYFINLFGYGVLGILLLSIGIIKVLHNRIKLSEKENPNNK